MTAVNRAKLPSNNHPSTKNYLFHLNARPLHHLLLCQGCYYMVDTGVVVIHANRGQAGVLSFTLTRANV